VSSNAIIEEERKVDLNNKVKQINRSLASWSLALLERP
jgi:hypothetical protein